VFCTKCGAQIEEGKKFCGECGNAVRRTEKEIPTDDLKTKTHEEVVQKDSMKCYFYEGTEKKGPFNYAQMVEFIEQGKILRDTLVWISGSPEWVVAEKSPLAKALGEVMPLAPINAISEKWIWALATYSVLIAILLENIALALRMSVDTAQLFVFIGAFVNNAIFLARDVEAVKQSGRNVASWLYIGIVLVPVYLYVREKHTNKNYMPLVVWCILFILQNQLGAMIRVAVMQWFG